MSSPSRDDTVNRTTLAWERTSAAASLVALWAAFTSYRLGEPAVGIVSTVVALAALVLGVTTPRASRSHPGRRPTWQLIERATLVLALTASLGVMLVLVEVFTP